MCINNTSHLIYPIKRSNITTLFVGNTKFTLGRPKIANFNSAKTFKITNSQTLISANISSFTVCLLVLHAIVLRLFQMASRYNANLEDCSSHSGWLGLF